MSKHRDGSVFVRKFKAAQRAWVAFRDVEAQARCQVPDLSAHGSMVPACECAEMAQLTQQRLKDMEQWRK